MPQPRTEKTDSSAAPAKKTTASKHTARKKDNRQGVVLYTWPAPLTAPATEAQDAPPVEEALARV